MADKICIDTDVLVAFLRNNPETVDWLTRIEKDSLLATTYVNAFELYYGAFHSTKIEKNLQATDQLLQRLLLLNLSQKSVCHAGECHAQLKKEGREIEIRDLLIGTIAQTEGFRLKTYNQKHFERIPNLLLEK